MAVPKIIAGDVVSKKMKDLKDHRKAEKEKTLAKRSVAAEKVKVKKPSSAPVIDTVIEEVMPTLDEADVEIASITKTIAKVVVEPESHQGKLRSDSVIEDKSVTITAHNEPRPTTITSEKAMNNEMMFEQPFDIVAYRKTLEAALYNHMETPRQMLIRCKFTASIDAEYYPVNGDKAVHEADYSYDYELDKFQSTHICLDDNRFEITPIITGLTEESLTARIDITPSLALLRLFDMIKNAGQTKVAISSSSVSRSLESVEDEMRLARDKGFLTAPAFVDPAIVSYKFEGHTRSNGKLTRT